MSSGTQSPMLSPVHITSSKDISNKNKKKGKLARILTTLNGITKTLPVEKRGIFSGIAQNVSTRHLFGLSSENTGEHVVGDLRLLLHKAFSRQALDGVLC